MRLAALLIGVVFYFPALTFAILIARNTHLPNEAASDASKGDYFNHFGGNL